jgi:hypothetical protein
LQRAHGLLALQRRKLKMSPRIIMDDKPHKRVARIALAIK